MTPFILRDRNEPSPESMAAADCVHGNRAKFSAHWLFRRWLEMCLAGVMIWSAATAAVAHADDETDLNRLLNHTLAIFVDDVASFLTNAKTLDGSFHLVRWNQSNIVLGLQITKGTSRRDVDPIVQRLIQTFGSVRKALKVCLYDGQVGDRSGDEVDDHTLTPCAPNETDIDVVVDLSSEADPSKYTAFMENAQAVENSYKTLWQRAISAVALSPDKVSCGGSTLSDDTATKIIRAGGVIRIPASTPPNQEIIDDCANLVSLDVLGVVRIANPNGRRARYSEDLLQLLYSPELNAGETREIVRAKLQSALSNNK